MDLLGRSYVELAKYLGMYYYGLMSKQTPTRTDVKRWIAGVEQELAVVDRELQPLVARQKALEDRLNLLRQLAGSLDEGVPVPPESDSSRSSTKIQDYVIERAVSLLREEGGPLHINEIHARFLQRGYRVPGAGRPVNLTAHIRDSESIVSPKRGFYGLVEHTGAVPKRNRKKRKRRKKS